MAKKKMNAETLKILENVVGTLSQSYGDESITYLGNNKIKPIPKISSQSPQIDKILGGGYPEGRIIEIYGAESSGKTTVCLHAIAEAQKKHSPTPVAFIDTEFSMDPSYAKALNVNVDELLISQPSDGQEAFNILIDLVKMGIKFIVVDSVAALVPRDEMEATMDKNQMGSQARMMSKGLRKLTSIVGRAGATILFTNQTRSKIGVMFGCFNYRTKIMLANGKQESIGKIVNNKMECEVLSLNTKTNKIEPKKIVNWYQNGTAEMFLKFIVEKNYDNGMSGFSVTPNHQIFVPNGYKNNILQTKLVDAGSINIGDYVIGKDKKMIADSHLPFILGCFLGDGSFRFTQNKKAQLRIGHGPKQDDYCKWKMNKLFDIVTYNGTNSIGGYGFDTEPLSEFYKYKKYYSETGKTTIDEDFLKHMTPLTVAIWYMDDGAYSGCYEKWGFGKPSIACQSFNKNSRDLISDRLVEIGFPRPTYSVHSFIWTGKRAKKFQEMVAEFIIPSMNYKLKPCFRQEFKDFELDEFLNEQIGVPVIVKDIYEQKNLESMKKFDLEIEGNHSYLASGVAVHNSPITTPGGAALKFFASIRMEIKSMGQVKDGDEVVSKKTKITTVKNKCYAPFKSAEFNIRFGIGIDLTESLIDELIKYKVLTKGGAWYKYNGVTLAQGRNGIYKHFKENPKTQKKLMELSFAETVDEEALKLIPPNDSDKKVTAKPSTASKPELEQVIEQDNNLALKAVIAAKNNNSVESGEV